LKIEFRGAEARALLCCSRSRIGGLHSALITGYRLAPELISAIVDEGKIAQASGDVG